jgi:hypothetical protein
MFSSRKFSCKECWLEGVEVFLSHSRTFLLIHAVLYTNKNDFYVAPSRGRN